MTKGFSTVFYPTEHIVNDRKNNILKSDPWKWMKTGSNVAAIVRETRWNRPNLPKIVYNPCFKELGNS